MCLLAAMEEPGTKKPDDVNGESSLTNTGFLSSFLRLFSSLMLYIYMYTKTPLSALVQVTMMFRALQETHQFDITGILELRLPNTRSNVKRYSDGFSSPHKTKTKS